MLKKEVYNPAQNISGRNLNKKENLDSNEGDVDESANLIDEYQREFKEKLLKAIEKMSPKKFEIFSGALLNKMGVEFDEVGARVSCDGGIDGHGYCLTDDFRISCVVIQCKRWQGVIGSPGIDKFLGAMNKFHAGYGVFITNSNYSREARAVAHAGTPITLIDGDELVRFVINVYQQFRSVYTRRLLRYRRLKTDPSLGRIFILMLFYFADFIYPTLGWEIFLRMLLESRTILRYDSVLGF